jgi:hypothetical protein
MSAPIICYGDVIPRASSVTITSATAPTTGDAVIVDRMPYRIYQSSTDVCQIDAQWTATVNVGYIGFAYTNSGFLGGQEFSVIGSTDGGVTTFQIAQQTISHDNAAIISFAQTSVNWLRIVITFPVGNNLFPFEEELQVFGQQLVNDRVALSVLQIGRVLQMPLPIYGGHAPITLNATTTVENDVRGQHLGRNLIRQAYQASYEFKHLRAAWYRSNFNPFVADALLNPFMISWRPVEYPEECAFVMLNDDVIPVNMGLRDLMSVSLSVDGFVIE